MNYLSYNPLDRYFNEFGLGYLFNMSKLFDDEFLDALAVVGFIIGVMNYDENLSQSDKEDMMQRFNNKAEDILERLEKDLEEQNRMLMEILEILNRGK